MINGNHYGENQSRGKGKRALGKEFEIYIGGPGSHLNKVPFQWGTEGGEEQAIQNSGGGENSRKWKQSFQEETVLAKALKQECAWHSQGTIWKLWLEQSA